MAVRATGQQAGARGASGSAPGPQAQAGGEPGPVPGAQARARARRIARLLAPAAWALGGFASAEARVHAGRGVVLRPDVLVAVGEPPADGALREPPLLAVLLDGGGPVAAWLALGAAVWAPHGGGARAWLADGTVTDVGRRGRLELPGTPGLLLPAAELCSIAALRRKDVLR